MAGNIGRNYIMRFHEKITSFSVSKIKYCVLTVYTVSHPHTELPFYFENEVACYFLFLWVKDDDCLGTLVSCEKYSKSAILSTLTARHVVLVTPYVYAYASSRDTHVLNLAKIKLCFLSQPPSIKLISYQYYPPYSIPGEAILSKALPCDYIMKNTINQCNTQ